MTKLCLGILTMLLLIILPAAPADVFYVASSGSATPPYNSWFTAATDLQAAIELAAVSLDGPHQIWVKKGVYKPQFNPHTEIATPQEYCFALRNNVGIYGGFAGTESALEERNPGANETILSGDRGTSDTWADGTRIVDASGTFHLPPTGDPNLDLPVLNADTNVYHVINNRDQPNAVDATALLDGCIVTGGYANGSNWRDTWGGGMCNESASPTLVNCKFAGNTAAGTFGNGGGISNWESSPILSNCEFAGNRAVETSGGMDNFSYSNPLLSGVSFLGNSANSGGGLGNSMGSDPTLIDCTFSGNKTTGGAGGGMLNSDCDPVLIRCAFSGNAAVGNSSYGGGMSSAGSPILTDCTFTENSASGYAGYGGGISNSVGSPSLINCTFEGNQARIGGGIEDGYSYLVMTNCTFARNSAYGAGGGMCGNYLSSSILTNCTFNSNTGGILGSDNASITATACVFYGGSYGAEFSLYTDLSGIRYCDVQGSLSGLGPGCISSDPHLGNLGYYGGITDCISIASDSPAIDSGTAVYQVTTDGNLIVYLVPGSSPEEYRRAEDGEIYDATGQTLEQINALDQRGYLRSGRQDMGSYEYGAAPSPTPILPSPTPTLAAPSPSPAPTARRIVFDAADFDGDGAGDLALWRSSDASWRVRDVSLVYYGLATDIPVTGDYNGDGGADYAVWRPLTGRWWVRGLYTNSTPLANFYFGTSGDVPVPADYDGDFRTDTAVWRPLNGYWAIKSQTRFYYGMNGDLSVPGDYNGDGRADPAVFRPSLASGVWYIRNISQRAWGLAGDFVTPGDFNGDGTTDLSVFRGYAGRWYTLGSGSVVFGQYGDIPVVIDYDGDGTSDRVLYRPSDGAWRIYGVTSISYGISTDQSAVGETY